MGGLDRLVPTETLFLPQDLEPSRERYEREVETGEETPLLPTPQIGQAAARCKAANHSCHVMSGRKALNRCREAYNVMPAKLYPFYNLKPKY